MERRELLRNSLLSLGAGLAGAAPTQAQAQAAPSAPPAGGASAPGQRTELDMLRGQEGMGNPREAHAYAMGMQAFQYGFPLI